jgi:hypothetical protein
MTVDSATVVAAEERNWCAELMTNFESCAIDDGDLAVVGAPPPANTSTPRLIQ